jgi:hypothetical protein
MHFRPRVAEFDSNSGVMCKPRTSLAFGVKWTGIRGDRFGDISALSSISLTFVLKPTPTSWDCKQEINSSHTESLLLGNAIINGEILHLVDFLFARFLRQLVADLR